MAYKHAAFFLDLTVGHAKLLNKMYHIFGTRLRYSQPYILNGSSLDPLLFLLYVNDLPKKSEFETTLIADGRPTYLAVSDKNIIDLECKVNKDLIKIDRWLAINKVSLNIPKSCYMFIKINQINRAN